MIREIIEAYYNENYHIEKLGGMSAEELAAALADNNDDTDENYDDYDEYDESYDDHEDQETDE